MPSPPSSWLDHGLRKVDILCSYPCDSVDDEWISESDDDHSFISSESHQLLNVEILTQKLTPTRTHAAPDQHYTTGCSTPLQNLRPLEFLLVFSASPNGQSCCATPPPPAHNRRSLPANTHSISRTNTLNPNCTMPSSSNSITQNHRPLLSVSSCSPDFFSSRSNCAAAAVDSTPTIISTSQPHSPMSARMSPLPPPSHPFPATAPLPTKPSHPNPTIQPSTSMSSSSSDPFSPSKSFAPHTPETIERTFLTPPPPTSRSAPSSTHPDPTATATDPHHEGHINPIRPSTAPPPLSPDLVFLDSSSRVLMSAPAAVLKEVVKIPLATSQDKFLYSVCPSSPDVLPMHCLGSGSFGEVKLVYVESPSPSCELRMCAVKTVRLVQWYGLEEFEREVELMGSCRDCPHVLHLFSAGAHQGEYSMMMEVAGHGCLKDLLWAASEYDEHGAAVKGFPEDVVKYLMAGLLLALDHLHTRSIVHLDVKPENMLLDSKLNTKLADFGIAQRLQQGQVLKDVAGTPGYQPPEMLAGEGYGTPADMWAAGIVAYQLVVGDIPEDWRLELLLERGIFRSPDAISQDLEDLLLGLLSVDPSKRLSARQALSHPWFHSLDMQAFQAGSLSCPTITLYHTPSQPSEG